MSIELKNISMKFKDTMAVNDLNLTIDSGKLVSLLGPSGCGKSTTLFMLAGLYEPTEGSILFNGKDVTKVVPEKRNIGMVFQNYALYPHMSVLKNIAFPLRMAKVGRKESMERAVQAAKLVEINHLLDRKPGQLSGGQQQRVAIARAIVREPEVLLLDEPLSNLDAKLRLTMREEIREIQQRLKITTLFVTHDQEEALSISDQVVLMKDGHLIQHGDPRDMYDLPNSRFVAEFIGSPTINVVTALNEAEIKELVPHIGAARFHSMAVRPEDMVISSSGLPVRVGLVEKIGKDVLVTVEHTSGQRFKVFVPKHTVFNQDIVHIQARRQDIHLFDNQGQRTGDVHEIS
ncbi:ABC transporter ATP-binding protein [Macrococcus carouselicus]|uniref:ABC transporter ATP-binding protein n=1 Tax=Macrococcus carouselicus TaxID=69969 RepID=A0A9Q8CJP9_9STAP|nr:ABC transporter ATP-binding protein [Macrococcus carouselicus]TDL96620.1 ABC transporter ATP-binding protein [Macrococcus carouselicus]